MSLGERMTGFCLNDGNKILRTLAAEHMHPGRNSRSMAAVHIDIAVPRRLMVRVTQFVVLLGQGTTT